MKNPVVPSWTESTRNLFKPVIVLVITFAATVKLSQSLYRYNLRRRSRARSGTMSSSSSSDNGTGVQARRRSRILSSKLYFDIPNSKVPLIYSSAYDITFLGIEKLHPFDSSKWGRICGFLLVDNVVDKNCIVEPLEASKNDLLVVHSEAYLNCLKKSANVAMIIEVPPVAVFPNCLVQQKVLYPFRNQVGGTILAAKLAKERGWAINVGGGFHHCSGEKGGGFCAYADISLCIHFAFDRLNISRVMIIDLDAHQGNGHETDFANDSRVYILDMYNPGIYPFDYEARRYIDQKVEVVSGTTTNEYLRKLDESLEVSVHSFDPELIVYNAGTDILDGDPLGRLKISPDGITNRDEKVFRFARKRNIPIVMLTSGGYMKSSARVIADSITNLSNKCLIDTGKNMTAT
ncbi:histone deacetylase 2 [Prunus yedoensis var. nudiflora]|uniref:histone deacetylase n=1 Tax=Prunus yedoensis var. nudiflora TaxID=2094558 RepID=A0A314UNB2_PRUYE|nr:histone deacetylase 2 [Prunus yedoensis var. nudiflora]